ncbi:hypothetical protein KY289_031063 [Solanum tuberosum]|nr:hypothetical protein KY284_030737 [Solanum tuberosum]KAH0653385.1 hypothetical protein KY289_031063 [Solanum tuberosum]
MGFVGVSEPSSWSSCLSFAGNTLRALELVGLGVFTGNDEKNKGDFGRKWVQLAVEHEARWRCGKMEEKIGKGKREREAASFGGRSCGLVV